VNVDGKVRRLAKGIAMSIFFEGKPDVTVLSKNNEDADKLMEAVLEELEKLEKLYGSALN